MIGVYWAGWVDMIFVKDRLPRWFFMISFVEGFLMGIGVIGSTTVSGTVSTSSSLVSPDFGS